MRDMVRYGLAGLIAVAAAFSALQLGVELLGLSPGFEGQAFALLVGLMTAATYEQVARVGAEERRGREPAKARPRPGPPRS